VIFFMWAETRVEREGSEVMHEPSGVDCVPMGDALTARLPVRPLRSKRLLALAGDERLVDQIRRGNELAFEVAFERHGAGVLGFCRHMLGSPEEAEDAVQHTFAAAFRDLQRGGERQIALKPWLYAIARNRCISVLRSRREEAAELAEVPTEGLHDQVARRSELRELLSDLRELPEEQRAALLLAEAADLSHAEVAGVLGCEVARVKALVFRARSGLIERREARETPCAEIREQLANLRGGSLRRSELRHHLRHCPGCSDYRERVRQQRQMLAAALPVVPSMGLKSSVFSAAGLGGGAAGGGAVAAGGGAAAGGGGLAFGGSLGSAAAAKVALVAVLAGGGIVAGNAAVERVAGAGEATPAATEPTGAHESGGQGRPAGAGSRSQGAVRGVRRSAVRSHGRRGAERRAARSRGNAGARTTGAPEHALPGGRRLGQTKQPQREGLAEPGGRGNASGRGQVNAPAEKGAAPRKLASPPRAQAHTPPPESEPVAVQDVTPVPVSKALAPENVKLPK
jgi:RNA polymerase sigma factor (sigma-70 family)